MKRARSMLRLAYLGRLGHISAVLLRFYLLRFGRGLLRRVPFLGRRLPPPKAPPRKFRELLEELGGTFIKFGQVLSLQPDVVPPTYCDELLDLLDRVPPFAFEEVEKIFMEDFGRAPAEIFDRFEQRPFASASIGQVHRASLGGRDLAVKVRRPTALRDFGGDIRLMKAAVWLIKRVHLRRLAGFRIPIEEFVTWTSEELDYRNEARYMEQVRINTSGRTEARVPAVIPEVLTARVLAAEYLDGTTLLEYLRALERGDPAVEYRLRKIGFMPEAFAENILGNFLGDVFRHGVFHADLHPANLLILPHNAVGYVDFGITGVISEYGREQVLAMILAVSCQDVEELFQRILKISEVTEESDVEEFHRGLCDLADGWFRQDRGVAKLETSYTLIMLDLIRLSQRCALYPHQEAMRYMRSVITADGLIARFAPDYDVNRALERLSKEHLRSRAIEGTFSADRLIETWIAAGRLMGDGALRLDRMLDRLERSEWIVSRSGGRSEKRDVDVLPSRATRLAISVLSVSILMVLGEEPVRLGLNLFSAELALIVVGTVLLGRVIQQWMNART